MTLIPDNPWLIPGITARLIELHGTDMTMLEISDRLSFEFCDELDRLGIEKIGRNSVIGRSRRLGLANRPNVPPPGRMVKIRKAVVVDAPIAPENAAPPLTHKPLTIYQLRDGFCKWPLGPVDDRPPFLYCGEFAEDGRSYCDAHHIRAHGQPVKVVWT